MFSIALPARQIHVSKKVNLEHLVPLAPRASWDGWFAIGVFDKDSQIRWLKAHLFHRCCRPGQHPVSSFEGMDGHSEMVITWATKDSVTVFQKEVNTTNLTYSVSPLRISLEDQFLFTGRKPEYRTNFNFPGKNLCAEFSFRSDFPIWWSRWGRFLTYCGQHGQVQTKLLEEGRKREMSGLGVLEHVAGMALSKDITTIFPGGFHWDVLRFDQAGSDSSSAAGLSLFLNRKGRIGIRAAAKLPGQKTQCMQGLSVHYLDVETREMNGKKIGVPLFWEGEMKSKEGVFKYKAKAITPVSALIPGGGMMGFDFEGEWKPCNGSTKYQSGVGFNEWGDFQNALVKG